MNRTLIAFAVGATCPWAALPALAEGAPAPAETEKETETETETETDDTHRSGRSRSLGVVTVTGGRPSSLPTRIPATVEGIDAEQIRRSINATDSEDALKYFPSLLVRKRYIGDFNHAILSSRASGTGNSARSAVYADGILLSNYLGNGIANGTDYSPRWGLVTPEQIERVDVMYGPFSAAYPGNSAGAIVDFVTRMPTAFEAHVQTRYFAQPWELYGPQTTYEGGQGSAALGSRSGDWSWWVDVSRQRSAGQPMTFANRTLAAGLPGEAGTPVSGALPGLDRFGNPWYILGTGTQYRTTQEQAKLKLAYDISPTVSAAYTLGWWRNDAQASAMSLLRDTAGLPVYNGAINIDGRSYNLVPGDFMPSTQKQTQWMHGLSVKSHSGGEWDWEVAASLFNYATDQLRQPGTALPFSALGGPGTIQDQGGTGWNTLAAKGTWRPQGSGGAHVVDFGIGRDAYRLGILKSNVLGNWQDGPAGGRVSQVGGKSELRSLWAQDSWAFAPRWQAVLGLRLEHWRAEDGVSASGASLLQHPARRESFASPKAALAWQWNDDTVLKAAAGRAVRMPTVGELYGGTSGGPLSFINDPLLKPEQSWTTEFSVEKDLGRALARATLFHELTDDALYSQLIPGSTSVSRVQNIDRIRTTGLELAWQGQDLLLRGLELGASLTYADSRIVANQALPSSVGKWQPRVPQWRATAVATYRPDAQWAYTLAARYSGRQYNTLDNRDSNGFAYAGISRYFTVDLRVHYQLDRQWSAAFGIDNLNNYQYWNFHPYPQRSYVAELRWDL